MHPLNKPNFLPQELKSMRLIFKKIIFLLFLGIATISLNAQIPDNSKAKIDKSHLSIKPNSRELNVVIRNNKFQRINKQRDHLMMKKVKQMRQQKIMKKNINQSRRPEMMQRRKLMIQQRKSIRR